MHQPLRTCVGCRAIRPQAEMLRSRCVDGKVLPDRSVGAGAERHVHEDSSPAPGRSAYLCPARACFEQAARRGGLARAFGRKLAVDARALWAAHAADLDAAFERSAGHGRFAAQPRVQRLAALAAAMRAAAGRVT
jgi:hypothetical protein